MDFAFQILRRQVVDRLRSTALELSDAGYFWEAWYVVTEVLEPLTSSTERDRLEKEFRRAGWNNFLERSEIESESHVVLNASLTDDVAQQFRDVSPGDALKSLGNLSRWVGPNESFQATRWFPYGPHGRRSLKRFGQILRTSASNIAHTGNYRAALRAGVLAPLSAVEPAERPTMVRNVIEALSGGGKEFPTAHIAHFVVDMRSPAIGANLIAGRLAELEPGQEREAWRHLESQVLEPKMGRTPWHETARMFFPFARTMRPGEVLEAEQGGESHPIERTTGAVGPDSRGRVDTVSESVEHDGSPPGGGSGGGGRSDGGGGGSSGGGGSGGGGSASGGGSSEPDNPAPQFFFMLEGDHVAGDQVQAGSDFDLVFDYDLLPAGALTGVRGRKLEELRQANADLDIWIIAAGVTVRDGITSKPAKFRHGQLEAKVRFALHAEKPVGSARIIVLFWYQEREIYRLPLRVKVVDEVVAPADPSPVRFWDLDAGELAETARERSPIEATLMFWSHTTGLWASLRMHDVTQQTPAPLDGVTLSALDNLLLSLKEQVQPVADHLTWTKVPAFTSPPESYVSDFNDGLSRVASAGSSLYQALTIDPRFAEMIARIDRMPDGSRLRIETNSLFLPWEILYPERYSHELPPEVRGAPNKERFWGWRFIIETRRTEHSNKQTPPSARQGGQLHISMNLNLNIDSNFKNHRPPPAASHETYYTGLAQRFGDGFADLQRTGDLIKQRLLASDNQSSLIYLYCHGENDLSFQPGRHEKLQLDDHTDITPAFLKAATNRYSGRPIVVINSCRSGAFSPLAFSTFLSAFQDRGALGLIPTTFSVPATFAAEFGQRFLDRYVAGERIGPALWAMRKEVLEHDNPLGLFYTLQCDLDTTAPATSGERAA